jgi:hypoxanthine phosphoribosyltransferase
MLEKAEPDPSPGFQDIDETLFDSNEIAIRVADLGAQISHDYSGLSDPLMLVGILKGCFVFLADLCRAISIPVEIELMAVTSYGAGKESSGSVRILKDLDTSITGRTVILVEGIVDTGLTLHYLISTLKARRPADLKVCTLLNKPVRRMAEVPIDYCGFVIEDRFVVGYGLDFNQAYRNLPYIATIRQ